MKIHKKILRQNGSRRNEGREKNGREKEGECVREMNVKGGGGEEREERFHGKNNVLQ